MTERRRLIDATVAATAPFQWPLAFVAVGLTVDFVWLRESGIAVSGLPGHICLFAAFLVVGLLWSAAGHFIAVGWPAVVLRRAGKGVGFFAVGAIAAGTMAVFSYACGRMRFPPQDAALVRIDALLGFDWPTWVAFLERYPAVSALLDRAYFTHLVQCLILYFVTAALNDRRRASEFFWTINFTAFVTCLISGVVPALGAKPFFHHGAAPWLPDLLALRGSGGVDFALDKLHGIVSMPSYHAALGLMFIWAARRTGLFGWAVTGLNVAMIVATLAAGGHYLIDVAAGLTLAAGVIWVVHRVVYGRRARDDRDDGQSSAINRYPPAAASL